MTRYSYFSMDQVMGMFDEEEIQGLCTRELTFLQGQQLQAIGAVKGLEREDAETPDAFYINAEVESSSAKEIDYPVWIRCSRKNCEIEDYACECAAFQEYPGMCRHCAATALAFLERKRSADRMHVYRGLLAEARKEKSDKEIQSIIRDYAIRRRMREQEADGTMELVPTLHESGWNYYYGRKSYSLTFTIGPEDGRKYVLKSLSEFAGAVAGEEKHTYGKKLSFVHSKSMFSEKGWRYVQLILDGLEMRSTKNESADKELLLNLTTMEQLFNLNLGDRLQYECSGSPYDSLQIFDENPPVRMRLTEEKDHYRILIPPLSIWKGNEHLFVRIEDQIYRCTAPYRDAAERLLECANPEKPVAFRIARDDMMAFCSSVLPLLEEQNCVDTGELMLEKYRPKRAKISFYLDEQDEKVTAGIECAYGDQVFNLLRDAAASDGHGQSYRDKPAERRALELARAYFPYEEEEQGRLCFDSKENDRMYQLLDTGIRQLEEAGNVYATDRIKVHGLIRSPKAQVGVSLSNGILELSVSSDSFTQEELEEILESYRRKKKYHRLRSGDFLQLDRNAVSTVADLVDTMGISGSEWKDGKTELPTFRAFYIDQALKDGVGQIRVSRDADYRAVIREMKNIEDSEYPVPEQMYGILREYQKTGYRWLRTLAGLGFGGILADEMGLGKTLQTITYLWARKAEGEAEHPSLIICPASLVYNWKRELEHFAPGLTVRMMIGTAASREEQLQDVLSGQNEKHADIWITSYDLLKRDIDLYEKMEFDTEIIDEAQNIKNQGTQAAKSVKKIRAAVRFALTGTPIENRLSELWSIFDYLMPGLLGSYTQFRKKYEQPIIQEEDQEASERLKRMIAPFILRRLKQNVLKELPDKLEQIVYARMEDEQRRLYDANAHRLQEMLSGKSSEELQKEQLQILAELTKLRQICCDPSLIYEDYQSGACKVDMCMELVKEAVEGKHKVLIFSQFTSLFPILEERLKQEQIAFYELTGRTPKEKRQQMTEAFDTDEVPVFLISLKAGGTGLNLTAASIVIHFDPWWNLAAQNQATDRAHRIGQQNQVVVFKLITQNTVEEKIVELQEKKQELAGQFLKGEALSTAMLSKEELLAILAE